MWLPILSTCLAACSLKLLVALIAQASRWRTRRRYGVAEEATTVAFFHPFCAGGGGGERVLWRAVHALSHLPKEIHGPLHVLIYTGDVGVTPEAILSGVARQFDISINPAALPVSFVYLRRRGLLDAGLYPVLTMLAQSAASVVLAAEALFRGTPDVFVDTTGFAFSFPVAWLAGCSVGAYVHYPTISTDMLSRVRDQRPSHNNSAWITSSVAVSRAKLLYYRAFAYLYGIAGGFFSSRVMVNSTWTRGHIAALWKCSPPPTVVFPPCDTSELESLPINDGARERCALSVGQFRPEKDHALQVRALAALRNLAATTGADSSYPSSTTVDNASEAAGASGPYGGSSTSCGRASCFDGVRLVILGSCRNDGDRAVLERTRALAVELGVEERVEFVVNCSFDELKAWLGRASVGLHTMWNEHFGIGVVEMMAAGMVTIAHRSGGPAADIVVPLPDGRITGFLAETPEEYAEAMARVFGENGLAQATSTGSDRNSGDDAGEGRVTQPQVEGGARGSGDACRSNDTSGRGLLVPRQQNAATPGEGGCARGGFSSEDVRVAGRESASRFSNDVFDRMFAAEFVELLQQHQRSGFRGLSPFRRKRGKEE